VFEARRCLSCGNCFERDNCYGVCPDNEVIKLGPGQRYQIDLVLQGLRDLRGRVPVRGHRPSEVDAMGPPDGRVIRAFVPGATGQMALGLAADRRRWWWQRADCPQSWAKEHEMSGITVGIDGSHNSHRALDWAVQEAAARNCGLTVLTVHPVIASWGTGNPVMYPGDKELQEKERLAVEEATEKALKAAGPTQPASVQVRSVSGFAAEELIAASRDSDLLVVGARGGGGFHRLTLGSVSDKVAHYSACPVVLVPAPER